MKRVLEPESMDIMEDALAYDSITRIYHFWMNRPQINLISKAISKKKNDRLNVLDVGTGTGRIPIGIAGKHFLCDNYAIDLSLNMLRVARGNIKAKKLERRITLAQADVASLPFKNNSFDVVSSCNMLHHLENPVNFLNEANRILKKDGIFVIRDLVRPASEFILNLFMRTIAIPYNSLMKKEFKDSLLAAFTVDEIQKAVKNSDIRNARIRKRFPFFVNVTKEHS